MNCQVSLTISDGQQDTTTVTCEVRRESADRAAQHSAEQLRQLREACLTAVTTAAGLAATCRPGQPTTKARPTLCQLARLYRAATRIMSFDLPQLQRLSDRLYKKPLEELSMIEVGGMIGTLNSIVNGTVDLHQVCDVATQPMNGRKLGA